MIINLKTTAESCHITVCIKIQNQILLSLTDTNEGSIDLFPGITYRFEWFVFAAHGAHARIQANVSPGNTGFQPLDIDKTYPSGAQDGNVFLFTLN